MDLLEDLMGVCVDEWHYGCVYGNLDVILNDFEGLSAKCSQRAASVCIE